MKNNEPKFLLTFEWHSLFRDLLRNSWAVFMAGLIAFMGIYVGEQCICTPAYTSNTTLAVRVKNNASSTINNLATSADAAKAYASVFQGSSMQTLAAAHLGLERFPGSVTTAVTDEINLITLSVTANDPILSYQLLTAILEVYPQFSEAIFSNAVIDTIAAPQIPESPSNRLSTKHLAALVLLAMIAWACLIILLSLLRETVKHEQAFEQLIDGRLLGTVVHEPPHVPFQKRLFHKKGALLIDSAFSSLRFSEDHQKVATKLEYLKKNQNASVFAITSVMENEGKSTITANLALALSERGYRVAVIDLDLRKPSLYKIMGYRAELEQEFSDVLSGRLAAQKYNFLCYKQGLFLALSSHCRKDAADWLGSDQTQRLLSDIRSKADFVLIDTPPASASADAAVLARMADRVILTIRTDRSAVADINDTISTLSNIGGDLAGCILNDVHKSFTFWGQMGADEDGAHYHSYHSRKHYGRYGTFPSFGEPTPNTPLGECKRTDGFNL